MEQRTMTVRKTAAAIVFLCGAVASSHASMTDLIDNYNVVRTTSMTAVHDKMPCGNGDITGLVWTQTDAVRILVGKTDDWIIGNVEGGYDLAKLARITLTFSPNPFASGQIKQTLDLRHGAIEVRGGTGASELVLSIWGDPTDRYFDFSGADALVLG